MSLGELVVVGNRAVVASAPPLLRPAGPQGPCSTAYTKGQNLRGSDVWFRIGKDHQLGFVHRATIDVPVNPPACDTV